MSITVPLDPIAHKVMDRWAAGEGRASIARDYPGYTRSWVSSILRRARELGDPRAVRHDDFAAGRDGWRQHYQVQRRQGKWSRWIFKGDAT
jgi:hypothetical protein